MGKINMGIFYGKKYNPRNRTFSLENGENFIEGTGLCHFSSVFLDQSLFERLVKETVSGQKQVIHI